VIYTITVSALAAVATVLTLTLIISGRETKKWIIADASMTVAAWFLAAVCWMIESG
jgi:hypothetical protein